MEQLTDLLAARRGHFLFESGHHGDLWLDLDSLFVRPRLVAPFAADLARRLSAHAIDAVCGPMTGGALVAQMVAVELDVELSWTERAEAPVTYRMPPALRARLAGSRVAIVDDVINAGSATRATLAELRACDADPVAVGALLVLNDTAADLAAAEGLALERLAVLESGLWPPAECPLCAAGVPLG